MFLEPPKIIARTISEQHAVIYNVSLATMTYLWLDFASKEFVTIAAFVYPGPITICRPYLLRGLLDSPYRDEILSANREMLVEHSLLRLFRVHNDQAYPADGSDQSPEKFLSQYACDGNEVFWAKSGAEAIAKARNNDYNYEQEYAGFKSHPRGWHG